MLHKTIGFHTRLYANNLIKLAGGSFQGDVSKGTIERLVRAHFSVTVKPSGNVVFVDSGGREVSLYLSIDASQTTKGREALEIWRADNLATKCKEEQETKQIEELLSTLSNQEIINRLKGQ